MTNLPIISGEAPKLTKITIQRDWQQVRYFNGIAFAAAGTHWVAWFRLLDDPIEYSIELEAPSQRTAHSRVLLILREHGVDVSR